MDYDYDLISGSVTEVAYQSGFADQFYHRYFYDSQNRLTRAATSTDATLWQEDARYYYYLHGPLARVELGQNQVQGTDYAYTLQGWLKGVNSENLHASNDIGKDGFWGNGQKTITTLDAYGFNLAYYTGGNGDYNPRGDLGGTGSENNPFATFTAAASNGLETYDLYNGNIARMSTTIYAGEQGQPGYIPKTPQLMAYRYDQLNRIHSATAAVSTGYDANTNTWTAEKAEIFNSGYTYDANGNLTSLQRHGNLPGNFEMDNLNYTYHPGTNRLKLVNDFVFNGAYDNDIEYSTDFVTQYKYDYSGNLISDRRAEIMIDWFANGKVRAINRFRGVADLPDLEFGYDAMGNRISKLVKTRTGTDLDTEDQWIKTYYVRDAQGNVMATYDRSWSTDALGGYYDQTDVLTLKEQDIYGSSRLGVRRPDLKLAKRNFNIAGQQQGSPYLSYSYAPTVTVTDVNPFVSVYEVGRIQYELSNHLGNVLSVVSDNIWVNGTGGMTVGSFSPDILAVNDYYPGGSIMPGRSFNAGTYRYGGAGGQEMDNEISGVGNSYTAEYWQYDSRLMRRWNVDPVTYPWQSSYAAFNNNPIIFVDPLGLYGTKRDARRARRQARKDGLSTGDLYKTGDDWAFGASDNEGYYTYVGTGESSGPSVLDKVSNALGALDAMVQGNAYWTFGIAMHTDDGEWNGVTANPVRRWDFDKVWDVNWDRVDEYSGVLKTTGKSLTYRINKSNKQFSEGKINGQNKAYDPTAGAYKAKIKVTTASEVKEKVNTLQHPSNPNWKIIHPEDLFNIEFEYGLSAPNLFPPMIIPLDSNGNSLGDTLIIR